MKLLDKIVTKLTLGKMQKAQVKRTVINDLLEDPEKFKAEIYIENNEIILKVKKRENEELNN